MRKITTIIALSLCFIILSVNDVKAATCKEAGCNRKATSNRGYCSSHTCIKCNAHRVAGSSYCLSHSPNRKTYTSGSSKSSHHSSGHHYYYDSYDDGYEDIWLDDDYDEERYYHDSDYAAGVDDAMDDYDW